MRQTDLRWNGRVIRNGALVLLLAVIILTHTGCTFRIYGGPRFGTYKNASSYKTGDFDYEAKDVKEVEVNWIDADITVKQSNAGTLHVSETDTGLKKGQKMHWLVDGDKLIVQYCESGYKGKKFPTGSKKLSIEIPEDVDLQISGVSAEVTLEGSQVLQNLKVDTVSGEVKAEDVTLSGKADIDSVSGDATLGLADCDKAELNSVSGDFHLTELPAGGATIKYDTVSGSVHAADYTMNDKEYIFGGGDCKISVETVSGDLSVK